MQFFEHRDLLIYPTRSPFLLQAVPQAREVNGTHVAVPRTLHNLQVLRRFDFPVPPVITDANYDWPRTRGMTPYESQKLTANFMVLNRRCFNLSDMGCVGGETLIDTLHGKQTIETLATAARKFVVRTLTSEGPRYVETAPPFKKGRAELFRVIFKSGRSIVVTKRHVFLTCRGWTSCGQLAISEQLPVFDVYPQQSIWEPCHVRSQLDARHLSEIVSNYAGRFDIPFYDAPPLSAANIDLDAPPSLACALERCQLEWQKDARDNTHIRTSQIAGDRHSKRRYDVRYDQGEMGGFLSECATKQTDNQFHISARCHPFPSQLREVPEDLGLRFCIPLDEASGSPFDTVVHIAYERTDAYYDMEVPVHANYVAHGLCNHNTGKTLATLWAADWLMQHHKDFRALIVAPLSILQTVWANAIFKNFLSRRSVDVLHGDAIKRQKILAESKADFLIVNYDGVGVGAHTRGRIALDGFSKALAERPDIRLVICDEASAYKDAQTKRHRLARQIIGNRDYLWLLTGTPTPNAPTDAYGLAKMVNNAFGKSEKTFRMESMIQVSNFVWKPQRDGYDKARRLLSPSIRIDIKDVWDGPAMTTQQRQVPLTEIQKKLMADLKRDLQVVMKSGHPITAANEAAVRQKFIQISLGAVYDHAHKAHVVDASPRLNELKAVIEQAPSKMLIFAPLTSIVNMLYKELEGYSREIVYGDTSPKDRARIFQAFQQESEPRLLIADAGTMAHGLDLWMAQTICWFGPVDKTELYLQANKRAHRPGQKHPVTVVQLVSNKLEQEIYRRLENNETMQGALLDMVRRGEL